MSQGCAPSVKPFVMKLRRLLANCSRIKGSKTSRRRRFRDLLSLIIQFELKFNDETNKNIFVEQINTRSDVRGAKQSRRK